MSTNIDSIKRKLLIKYPTFGSVMANLEFQANKDIETAGTDGKVLLYNPKFLENLPEKQQTFIFAHEVCHVAFEHIFRSEGKDKRLWNIATDAVINALLKQDGLPIVEGGIDIPEAVNYDAEEMYDKLLEEKKNQEEQNSQGNQGQQNSQGGQGQQNSQGNQGQQNLQGGQEQQNSQGNQEQQNSQGGQEQQDSQGNQEQQNSQGGQEQQDSQGNQEQQNSQSQKEETDIGHDTHSLWDKAIEERKKEQQEEKEQQKEKEEEEQQEEKEEKEGKEQQEEKAKEKKEREKEKRKDEEESKFVKQGEKETFKQNRIERRKQLQELSRELASKSSKEVGNGIQREKEKVYDIGVAAPLIDWRKLLRQAIKYNEEYTRKNARMRNGYFRHKLKQFPMPEAEILLDTSGSVSEILLKNFLRECKNILDNSKVKVGCFNTEFHGFTELKKPEDIDNMRFPLGGGTDFNVAVEAFSRKASNKIIFTDGEASMPRKTVRNVIWVVFGNKKINPKGGRVINIKGEQLRRLYQSFTQEKDDRSR